MTKILKMYRWLEPFRRSRVFLPDEGFRENFLTCLNGKTVRIFQGYGFCVPILKKKLAYYY